MVTFWAALKNITFFFKMLWLFFGQLLERLGYILVKHLVTLLPVVAGLKAISNYFKIWAIPGLFIFAFSTQAIEYS